MLSDELCKFTSTTLKNNVYELFDDKPELIALGDASIQAAVMRSYDVRSDAVGLRNLPTLETTERPAYFDSLRKNYPIRREFNNRMVHADNLDKNSETQLTQLGFELKNK